MIEIDDDARKYLECVGSCGNDHHPVEAASAHIVRVVREEGYDDWILKRMNGDRKFSGINWELMEQCKPYR